MHAQDGNRVDLYMRILPLFYLRYFYPRLVFIGLGEAVWRINVPYELVLAGDLAGVADAAPVHVYQQSVFQFCPSFRISTIMCSILWRWEWQDIGSLVVKTFAEPPLSTLPGEVGSSGSQKEP